MKKGILVLFLASFLFTSCNKRTCPAYGSTDAPAKTIPGLG